MSSLLRYISFYLLILLFSCSLWGIEISDSAFLKPESEEEEETELELSAPNMGRAYKKEQVVIKRDVSALDSAVDSANQDQKGQDSSSAHKKTVTEEDSHNRLPSSVDYGDYEIHWKRQ